MAGMAEDSKRLRIARREINPLQSKSDNPVKKAARATVKARESKKVGDIAGASSKTQVATIYAKSHGYPNLTRQLGQHKDTLRKFAAAVKKRKATQTKAAGKARMRDLKTKLWKLKLKRRRTAAKP